MKHTLNYKLNLPEKDDAVEINDLNQNFRKIDSLIHDDSITIKQNVQKIQHLQDKKADTSYVDAQVELAGKVDSVNGKQGEVVLTAKDINLELGSNTNIYTSLKSKADMTQTNRDISNLRAESSQHKSDIENLRSIKADKSALNSVEKQVSTNKSNINKNTSDISNNKSNINKLKNSIKIVKDKLVYSSNWSSYDGKYRAKISDSSVTANSIVDVNIHLNYLDRATYLYPVSDSYSGGFYIYAKKKPGDPIKFDYKITREG